VSPGPHGEDIEQSRLGPGDDVACTGAAAAPVDWSLKLLHKPKPCGSFVNEAVDLAGGFFGRTESMSPSQLPEMRRYQALTERQR
jgi:hypothetical protein